MWFVLSLFFAVWTSIAILISKKLVVNFKPVHIAIISSLFTIPFMFLLLLYVRIPTAGLDFYKFLLVSGALDAVAAFAAYKALTLSPISLLSPISSFNPIFTLIFASIFLSEMPTPIKFLGIIIIAIGSYLLNIRDIRIGLLKPFTKLFSDKGVRLFLLSNLIWGLTPIFQKQAIFVTTPHSPIFAASVGMVFATVFLLPFGLKTKITNAPVKKYLKWFLLIGPMASLAAFAGFTAFSLTNVAYATAIFKLSTLFTIILGAVFLKETRIGERLLGACVMLAGAMLLAL